MAALRAIEDGSVAGAQESTDLDFKAGTFRSAEDSLRKLAEALACMANADGGSVVVGVADELSGPQAIQGTMLDPEEAKRRVYDLTQPPILVEAFRASWRDRTLVILNVPSGASVHAVNGRMTERVGRACLPMSADRVADVVAVRRGEDWSAVDSGLPIRRVDAQAMAAARRFFGDSPDPNRSRIGMKSDPDLLRGLGVVTGEGHLTRAGAMLLVEGCDIGGQIVYTFRRTSSGSLQVNDVLQAPLATAITRLFESIDVRTDNTSVNIPGGQQLQVPDLPAPAIREAIINAIMHRDYRVLGRIAVEHSPARMAVTSPGPFLPGITPDNILTASSRARNPQLASALRLLGLAETAGSGVDRMYAEMAGIGHQPPSYTSDSAQVRVTLLGGAPNTYVTQFTTGLRRRTEVDADTMLVLMRLLHKRTVDADSLTDILQKPPAEVQGILRGLAAAPFDLIEPTRESATWVQPKYRLRREALAALGPAVAYQTRSHDDYDRMIVGLIEESGSVNGRMVQLVLGVAPPTASRILADLVARGLLVKTSAAQRGPGVTYGPGPSLKTIGSRRGRRRGSRPGGFKAARSADGGQS